MTPSWHICSQDANQVSELAETLQCQQATAAVLINRGLSKPERAHAFLNPAFDQMRSPFLMKDMDKAVSRIMRAIHQKEKIFVFGDYDVDGMTATALLLDFFSHLDLDVSYHVPNRLTEGYGLTPEAIETFAKPLETDLIITVDCGISNHEAVKHANRFGMDVIITDHHEVPSSLPKALAILNPKQSDCPSELANLAGVGVAFSLVLALRKALRDEDFWKRGMEPNLKQACDLVALGTTADMVPLLDENRIYVKAGLDVLSNSPRPGLKALLRISGATDRPVDTWDLAFRLAPRLNAAGRLGHNTTACDLLTTAKRDFATALSEALDQQNTKRKAIENEILEDIMNKLQGQPDLVGSSLVLESRTWHEGVIGIVAARLVAQFARPVVLIAVKEDGMGKGSARAPEGFHVFRALEACSQYLEQFGGHEGAAGLSIKPEKIVGFREAFDAFIHNHANPEDFASKLRIDARLSHQNVCPALVDEIERLAPFGSGNPEPLFALSDLEVVSAQPVGQSHMRMRLIPTNGKTSRPLNAIYFNADSGPPVPKHIRHMACHLRWNRWQQTKRLQLVIKDIVEA
jgi:single-stranded-DNA-specific exonuclease